MAVVYEAKVGLGKLTVTDEAVSFHQPGVGDKTISRAAIIGIDRRAIMAALFGAGGMDEVTVRTNGGPYTLKMPPKIAKQLMQVLGYA